MARSWPRRSSGARPKRTVGRSSPRSKIKFLAERRRRAAPSGFRHKARLRWANPVCRERVLRRTSMPSWLRVGFFAALFLFATAPSQAAEKSYQDDALNDAAITLEADLKDEAGTVEKPLIKLRQEAEALIKANDLAGAADVYVQIVTIEPNDARAWRRLADLWLAIPKTDEDDGSTRFERARTAAYIAYQRATT